MMARLGTLPVRYLSRTRTGRRPPHMPVEVLWTLRRYEAAGVLTTAQAGVFATEVGEATVRYAAPDSRLLAAVWARRHNVSPYDAGYLALADVYGTALVTLDERLARAAGQAGVSATVPESCIALNTNTTRRTGRSLPGPVN